MNEQITLNPKLSQPSNNGQPKSWGTEYYEAFRAAFERVWHNKYLWFWGILLPGGVGSGLNYSTDRIPEPFKGQLETENAKQVIEEIVSSNWEYIVLIIVAVIVLMLAMWAFSAIARAGTIKAQDELQTTTSHLTFSFSKVWREGKTRFLQIMAIDFLLGLCMFALITMLSAPVIFLFTLGNVMTGVLLGLLAVVILIPIILLAGYLSKISVIVNVLANQRPWAAIEAGYLYIKDNIREALKLLFALFVFGIFQVVILLGFTVPLVIITFPVSLLFKNFLGLEAKPWESPGGIAALVIVVLLGLIFLVCVLIIRGITSLWTQDVWVWWTKRVGKVNNIISAKNIKQENEKILRAGLPELEN